MKKIVLISLLFSGISVFAQSPPPNIPTNGLIAWYPFSDNANDESGNGYNGTVYGATLYKDRFGNPNSCYYFNGLNDSITSIIPVLPTGDSARTISAWFVDSTGFNQYGSTFKVMAMYGPVLNYERSGLMEYYWNPVFVGQNDDGCYGCGGCINYANPGNIDDGNWHNFIATYANDTLRGYLDGQLSFLFATTYSTVLTRFIIGFNGDSAHGNGEPWEGLLDDIGIWNRALIPAEVISVYNGPLSGTTSLTVSPTATDTLCSCANTTFHSSATSPNNAINYKAGGYFTAASSPSLNSITNQMTAMCWINTAYTGDQKMFGRTDYNFNSGYILGTNNGGPYFQVYDSMGNNNQIMTGSFPLGTWAQLTLTYNAGGYMYAYVNGLPIDSIPVTYPVGANTDPFIVGAAPWDQNYFQFQGGVDEIRLYNVALTQSQIQAEMNKQVDYNSPGLVAYWSFDEGAGQYANDLTGNGNQLTMVNNPQWVDPSNSPVSPVYATLWNPAVNLSSDTAANPMFSSCDSGIYTFTVTVQNIATQVKNSDSVKLVIESPSTIIMQPANVSAIVGAKAKFYVTLASLTGIRFQWQTNIGLGWQNLYNAGQYSGVYTDTLTVSNVAMLNNNDLFRCILSGNPCSDSTIVAVLTIIPTGIANIASDNSFCIYPNPTTSQITLQICEPSLIGSQYEILDQQGRYVLNGIMANEKNIIAVDELSAGTYMIRLTKQPEQVVKFIKQ